MQYVADLLYTVQLVISDVCTNLKKILGQVVPEKSLTQIYNSLHWSER